MDVQSRAMSSDAFRHTLDRLINASINTYYNPYKEFQWPASMPDEQWWMSRDLLSIAGTPLVDELPTASLQLLSKWESVNFYSLNVHGIRDLLLEVTRRIHTPGFEEASEFFHHFLGEENEHMWFFASFCLRYGGKVYPDRSMRAPEANDQIGIKTLLVFVRILVFEELVDFFNRRMGKDESLHPCIRQINNVHHRDETRHLAFGREIVKILFARVRESATAIQLAEIEEYVARFTRVCLNSLYNPAVYKDAGIPEPYELRRRLLADPMRSAKHKEYCANLESFLTKTEIVREGGLLDERYSSGAA
jgi:hypothetical protein